MPIEPIDLQVLFSRMLDVGKEQAARNELVNVAQSAQAGELVRKTEEQSHSVNETKETDEVRQAKEQGESGGAKPEGKEKKKGEAKRNMPSFQDPDLGKNIDITG